ncbi:uncharacterized protein BDZ99DRAFT_514424 [Mytilinidion resinicola]|uniref:Zn(2)-C6 fungal-type domain-containing protein n=1 Tax=Mytilinidion resinicola TaxID=574789 RepID=A0A6A6Z3P9_9PEZI|nr:uncharacterized protein BDZ99DRAFT_514424 [Mytilinidion resinicola]KAF2815781.1 hypothetical protein BDZ99DRAFT_514424 [Mytilinidion resinicola]
MNHSTVATTASNASPAKPKPIRFVTNHDGPYAKRRRINSACLTCRRRKTRCSGERPVCGTCTQNKHECGGYGPEGDAPFSPVSEDSKDVTKKTLMGDASHTTISSQPRKHKLPAQSPQDSRPSTSHKRSIDSSKARPSDNSRPSNGGKLEEDAGAGLSLSTRNRMPYFRYFGPTAIMPGFKQMVVKVRGKRQGTGHTSSEESALESSPGVQPSHGQYSPVQVPEARTPIEIPVYDTSAMSPSPLITHLCKTFFTHLGCSFPFLQRDRFLRDLEEKQVDAILVDAVCALAARFSTHPMLTGSPEPETEAELRKVPSVHPSEHGQAFAQRAKSAIPDTFPCPSVAVVQAALLLAYDEFGASRDSGLWMYLGIAIRMAQDLGMQTLEGLRYEGRSGPTPKTVKTAPTNGKHEPSQERTPPLLPFEKSVDESAIEEQRAVERERVDTFWSIFFLDRVISSGTGRPVTLRDRDIEISFPSLDEADPVTAWPVPFPALIRIIHLYGRVTDLLNSIKEVSHVTQDVLAQLAAMENHLTDIYQGLSPRLHFNAVNFQHYVKVNQGTNFVLLHFWFHTLIVLLHQPTLLKTFEGSIQQLLPNSRELSMSSAKTIADILSFAELIDSKSALGNPFTSQPIYVAACAFLRETALHSASSNPHSRPSTPGSHQSHDSGVLTKTPVDQQKLDKQMFSQSNGDRMTHLLDTSIDKNQAAKHTLLASAANQNYQRCYRALKSLETYWAGVKYILTVLDQKAKGVGDPLLYTREEMESALELPRPEPAFTSPGWRRKLSWGTYLTAQGVSDVAQARVASALRHKPSGQTISGPASPMMNQAIGWSLTGTMNSPSTSLAVLYPTDTSRETNGRHTSEAAAPSIASILSTPQNTSAQPKSNQRIKYEHGLPPPSPSFQTSAPPQSYAHNPSGITTMPPPSTYHNMPSADPVLVSDADLLLNLHSPYSTASPGRITAGVSPFIPPNRTPTLNPNQSPTQDFSPSSQYNQFDIGGSFDGSAQVPFGDMMIQSQDIDMSALGDDMMPWLEYLPHEMLYYDGSSGYVGGSQGPGGGMEGGNSGGG